jgi:hypothetical protein
MPRATGGLLRYYHQEAARILAAILLGPGAADAQAGVNEAPNLAARLQALAERGAVVIAGSTQALPTAIGRRTWVLHLKATEASLVSPQLSRRIFAGRRS